MSQSRELGRIVVSSPEGRRLVERSEFVTEQPLQDLVERIPELLEEIEPGIRLVPIGREVSLASGRIDLLFLDSEGLVTIVETKLRVNSESRREVVGQILEYAAEVSDWSVRDVEEVATNYLSSHCAIDELRGATFDQAIARRLDLPEDDPAELEARVDEVRAKLAASLAEGRLRIVIALDSRVESLAQIVRYLSAHSDLQVILLQVSQFSVADGVTVLVPSLEGDVSQPRRERRARAGSQTLESMTEQFPSGLQREAFDALMTAARKAGASFEFGSVGLSVRVRSRLWSNPITVAWFFPPETPGWMKTHDLSFGWALLDAADLPKEIGEILSSWQSELETLGIGEDASSRGVAAVAIGPDTAAANLSELSRRFVAVIQRLAAA